MDVSDNELHESRQHLTAKSKSRGQDSTHPDTGDGGGGEGPANQREAPGGGEKRSKRAKDRKRRRNESRSRSASEASHRGETSTSRGRGRQSRQAPVQKQDREGSRSNSPRNWWEFQPPYVRPYRHSARGREEDSMQQQQHRGPRGRGEDVGVGGGRGRSGAPPPGRFREEECQMPHMEGQFRGRGGMQFGFPRVAGPRFPYRGPPPFEVGPHGLVPGMEGQYNQMPQRMGGPPERPPPGFNSPPPQFDFPHPPQTPGIWPHPGSGHQQAVPAFSPPPPPRIFHVPGQQPPPHHSLPMPVPSPHHIPLVMGPDSRQSAPLLEANRHPIGDSAERGGHRRSPRKDVGHPPGRDVKPRRGGRSGTESRSPSTSVENGDTSQSPITRGQRPRDPSSRGGGGREYSGGSRSKRPHPPMEEEQMRSGRRRKRRTHSPRPDEIDKPSRGRRNSDATDSPIARLRPRVDVPSAVTLTPRRLSPESKPEEIDGMPPFSRHWPSQGPPPLMHAPEEGPWPPPLRREGPMGGGGGGGMPMYRQGTSRMPSTNRPGIWPTGPGGRMPPHVDGVGPPGGSFHRPLPLVQGRGPLQAGGPGYRMAGPSRGRPGRPGGRPLPGGGPPGMHGMGPMTATRGPRVARGPPVPTGNPAAADDEESRLVSWLETEVARMSESGCLYDVLPLICTDLVDPSIMSHLEAIVGLPPRPALEESPVSPGPPLDEPEDAAVAAVLNHLRISVTERRRHVASNCQAVA